MLQEVSGQLYIDDNPVAISGQLSIGANELTSYDFDSNAIMGFDATLSNDSNTSYTLSSSDSAKIVSIDNSSDITVTVPTGLDIGFNCSFLQKGAGSISFSASGTTINNRQSHTQTAGQYAMATLICYDTDTFVLAGDTVE